MQNSRDRKRQRNCTRNSPSPGDEGGCPSYPPQRSPKHHKSRMPLNTFCLVQLELNHPGSSQLHFSVESSLNQTNCHFFLQSQCILCNGAYINHSILCFNFNMLKWKTFNTPLTFIHLYKVLVSCVKLCSGWVIQTAQHLYTGVDSWSNFPQCFHWEFQVFLWRRIFLPIQQGNFGRGPLALGTPGLLTASVFGMK